MIQLGTTLAIVIYFWRELLHVIVAWFRGLFDKSVRGSLEYRMGWYLILATIPVGVFGLVFSHQIETGARNLWLIAFALIALALRAARGRAGRHPRPRGGADQHRRTRSSVGTAQALALIPGASRSGTTITAGLFRGLTREAAARFSFLLSIPAVVLSGLYEARKIGDKDGTRRRADRRRADLRVRRRAGLDPLADAVADQPQHVHLHLLPDRARRAADRAARRPACWTRRSDRCPPSCSSGTG